MIKTGTYGIYIEAHFAIHILKNLEQVISSGLNRGVWLPKHRQLFALPDVSNSLQRTVAVTSAISFGNSGTYIQTSSRLPDARTSP